MKWVLYFSFLLTVVFAQDRHAYEKHFPKDIYECLIKKRFFDEGSFESKKEMQYVEEVAMVSISLDEEHGKPYALIDYCRKKDTGNFSGIQAAYRDGQLIAYVIFDEQGRDYLAFAPFEDEKGITLFILDLMEQGYLQLVQEAKG
ncbi:MAG: hypothetical protein COT84_02845 [Chlamydiae bacterium CG10_big_fil_rev_8_21_14_0_10_35_9]|nr:MAG: hypothetical protein COT84_02845 [Chlamydiae bacterium CG10_big_fil_rev_8_21_14_0_10_35_9]